MKKTQKRILALLLLVAMIFSINITSIFAANTEPKVYSKGENTLNLEGNFSADGNDGAIWVKDGAQLTINGTDSTKVHAELGADDYSMAVWAKGKGTKVIINGGYYTNETDGSERGTDLIYASEEAKIEINGGTFKAAVEKWTLNCKDISSAPIIVKGGTFYKFDPSNANVGDGEVVVPEGYKVVKNGDWYTVCEESKVYSKGENTLNLEGNFSADGNDGAIWVKDGAQLTINGTDTTKVHAELGADDYSMAVWAKGKGTKVIINGGYYTNETDGSERGTDLIYASEEAKIEINGGTFKAAVEKWTLNCKDISSAPIIVKGGTFYKFDPSNANVGDGEVVVPEGYQVVKNGDWYSVLKIHTITVKEAEGGKIIVREVPTSGESKEINKAVSGTTVEIIVEPAEGYKFKDVSGISGLKNVAEYAYQFTMPNKDIVLTPVFEKYTMEAEVSKDVVDAEKVEEIVLETLKEEIAKDDKLAAKLEGKDIEVEVKLSDKEIDKAEKEKIEKEIKDVNIVKYIDITIVVKDADTGDKLAELETVKKAITFTVAVPNDLPEVAEGFTRIFYIIREHDGKVEILETKVENGKLVFESDKFSTYAIAYKDVENSGEGEDESQPTDTENQITTDKNENQTTTDPQKNESLNIPQTGDNVFTYIILAVVSITGIIAFKKSSKSRGKH